MSAGLPINSVSSVFGFFVVTMPESSRNSRRVFCGGFFCFARLATRPLWLDPLL